MDFASLMGQNFVVSTLKSAIENNRIAHAYLFSGPRGVGKTTLSRLLAKALCCEHGPTTDPCGKCDICKSITASNAVDVIEIDGASNTGVDDIRAIKEELMFPPSYCRYKIYIIDEVHMLSTSAFNALLKTIEEPPQWAIFIFATTELQKVPLTIQSRCQCFRLKSIEENIIRDLIKKTAKEDSITIDEESALWISKRARGSQRDAYTIFDQCVAFSGGNITFEKIKNELGITGADELKAIFEEAVSGNTQSALLHLDELIEAGKNIESFTSDMTFYIRDALFVSMGITSSSILYNPLEYYKSEVIASLKKEALEIALERFLTLYKNIKYSLNPRFEAELELARLSNIRFSLTKTGILKQVEELKNMLVQGAKDVNPELLISIQRQNFERNAALLPSAQSKKVSARPTSYKEIEPSEEPVSQSIPTEPIIEDEPQGVEETLSAPQGEAATEDKEKLANDILKAKSSTTYRLYKSKKGIEFKDGKAIITLVSAFALLEANKGNNKVLITDALSKAYGFKGEVEFVYIPEEIEKKETVADNIAAFFKGRVI